MGKSPLAALAMAAAFSLASYASPPAPLALLHTTFQDHAVLQRGKPIPVWGLASPGAHVNVTLAGEAASATADASG